MSTTKNKLPPFIETYRVLIAIPSISATGETLDQNNADLITLLADWLRDLSLNVEVQPVPGTHSKFNILVSCGQRAGDLLLVRHTDTASLDDGCWTRDPFTLTKHDGKFYGLGTADIKSFFAFILGALCDVDITRLVKPLYILVTVDEEASMAGARYLTETTALRPDCAVIGKPTSLQPARTHKDHISNTIRIRDRSGRSSDPVRGVNAIELIHDAIRHILQLRGNLKEHYYHDAFTVSYPTLNLGHIRGGDASSRICACYELHMNTRPLPGMILNEFDGLLNDTLAPVNKRWPGRLMADGPHPPTPGYECLPNRQLVEVVEKLLGAKTEVVNYCTGAPSVQTLCLMLALGPDSINQAHQPDEYLETRFIEPTRELTTQVIHHFCWH